MNSNNSIPVFFIKGNGWKAQGQMCDDGFVIFKDSTVASVAECFKKQKSYYNCRVMCEADNVIVSGAFVKDFIFKSAAQAASVVSGRLANVNQQLKTEDGKTFGELYPKRPGEKRKLTVVEEKVLEEAPLGLSITSDGVSCFCEEKDGKRFEYRGQDAERRAHTANLDVA